MSAYSTPYTDLYYGNLYGQTQGEQQVSEGNLFDNLMNGLNTIANTADKVNDTYLNIKNGNQSQSFIDSQQRNSGVSTTSNKNFILIAGAAAVIGAMFFMSRR